MAILNFKHLKKQSAQQTSPAPVQVVIPASAPAIKVRLQRPRAMQIMDTALLASVNYCDGCPRFWPADENEKAMGVEYGRCCRIAGWQETWTIIPVAAKVGRCWYNLQPESFWSCNTEIIGELRK